MSIGRVARRVAREALGMPLIRAGYSALAPGAWLKPHYGTTNAQLKWHLGQLGNGGTPCCSCSETPLPDFWFLFFKWWFTLQGTKMYQVSRVFGFVSFCILF